MAKSDLFKSSTPHASIKLTHNPNDDFLSSSFFNGLLSAPGYFTLGRLFRQGYKLQVQFLKNTHKELFDASRSFDVIKMKFKTCFEEIKKFKYNFIQNH